MDKIERDRIEAALPEDRRFRMPASMTDAMRQAAYRTYCARHTEKGCIAWADICACFRAADDAK